MNSSRHSRTRLLLIIAAAYAVYAAVFILRSSTVIDGVRFFALQDDEMISMRYAANLAHGYGLVWNPGGPPLEGYTNLLWVLYMSIFHLAGISAAKVSLCIQLSGALFLIANLFVTDRIAERLTGSSRAALLAAGLTALYFPLNDWALQGSEVGLLVLIFSTAILLALTRRAPIALYALLGLSTLVRPDASVFGLILLATMTALRPAEWKRNVLGIAVVAGFIIAQTVFRLWYFHNPLPNTYYLKLTGFPLDLRVVRGLAVFAIFVASIAPLIFFIGHEKVFRRLPAESMLLLAPMLGQAMYSIYVGGDAWEWWGGSNRYIAVVMPLVFVLAAAGLESYCWPGAVDAGASPRSGHLRLVRYLTTTAGIALVLVSPQYGAEGLLLYPPPETAENAAMIRQALLIERVTDPDATAAVVWAGIIPYFDHRTAIDLLGKCDSTIAHEQSHQKAGMAKWVGFYPGHTKVDYDYSVGTLAPDVVVQLWTAWSPAPKLEPRYVKIELDGFTWYVRRDSVHFRWDVFRALGGTSETTGDSLSVRPSSTKS
jgi:hypothetical protein